MNMDSHIIIPMWALETTVSEHKKEYRAQKGFLSVVMHYIIRALSVHTTWKVIKTEGYVELPQEGGKLAQQ